MNIVLKLTILSLSLLTVMSGAAVAPALAKIAAAFPVADPTSIKLILTLPALFIIACSLLSGRLSGRVSKRWLLIVGLVFYLLGGIGGGFAGSIGIMLVFRALLGIGVGLIMPLSTGLIADFFSSEERGRMMGYSTAASNLGGIIATLAAGTLAALSWRYAFGVYGLGILSLLLVVFFLPEPSKSGNEPRGLLQLPGAVYCWAGGAFFLMIAFYSLPVNLAIFLEKNEFGGAAAAGLAISLATASGLAAGLSFARLRKRIGSFLPAFVCGLMFAGFLLLSRAESFSQVLVAICLIGLALGWTLPALFLGATRAGGEGQGVPTMALVSSMMFLGQFLSPLFLSLLGHIGGDLSARFSFAAIAWCYALVCLVVLFFQWRFGDRKSDAP